MTIFWMLSSLPTKIFYITNFQQVLKSPPKPHPSLANIAKTLGYKSDYKPYCTERKKKDKIIYSPCVYNRGSIHMTISLPNMAYLNEKTEAWLGKMLFLLHLKCC